MQIKLYLNAWLHAIVINTVFTTIRPLTGGDWYLALPLVHGLLSADDWCATGAVRSSVEPGTQPPAAVGAGHADVISGPARR